MKIGLDNISAAGLTQDDSQQITFSQFGEDLSIIHVMEVAGRLPGSGFYVDVGAHHPRHYSNTFLLHRLFGWSGINIDPNAEHMELFRKERPNDRNLCMAVAAKRGSATYTKFNKAGINSLDARHVERHAAHEAFDIIGTEVVETWPLATILDVLAPGPIDLLNVDVEGMDLEVLQSNDWTRYQPLVVAVEDHGPSAPSGVSDFMVSLGYRMVSHVIATSIYVHKEWPQARL